MCWDLLCYPHRKRKLIKTLHSVVDDFFLNESVYLTYYDIKRLGPEYARRVLHTAVHIVIKDLFVSKGLEEEYASSGMVMRVHYYFQKLEHLDGIVNTHPIPQHVFVAKRGVAATNLLILVGDMEKVRLEKSPDLKTTLNDLMFDLYHSMGDTSVPPVLYGDVNYSLNRIKLKR